MKALLAADEGTRAIAFRHFVDAEMGLFEGVLAVSNDQAVFVRDRFGTLELEPVFALADVNPSSVELRDALFGKQLTWAVRGARQQLGKIDEADATRLETILRGGAGTTRAAPVAVEAAAPMPAPPSVVIAPTVTTAPVSVTMPSSRAAPKPASVVVSHVATVGTAPGNPRLASQRPGTDVQASLASLAVHAFFAAMFLRLIGTTLLELASGTLITSVVTHRAAWWVLVGLSLPFAELAVKIVRARIGRGDVLQSPWAHYPETASGRVVRHLGAGAFAGFAMAFFTVFIEPRFGPSELHASLTMFALGVALTWPKDVLPWLASGIVLVVGDFIGARIATVLYGFSYGEVVYEHVSISIGIAWFAHLFWMRNKLAAGPPSDTKKPQKKVLPT